MTLVAYVAASLLSMLLFRVFVLIFDMLSMSLLAAVYVRTGKGNQPIPRRTIMAQSLAKGFCTNIVVSLAGIGIIMLFGANPLVFPAVYLFFVVMDEMKVMKVSPPFRANMEKLILFGNALGVITVYCAAFLVSAR